uniref:Uncharacterized protein n=1 Tax=Vespula pensylvanica TaxID=30213 RepID=A0A834UD72_VESPE|nr:hypothetical protein H0235_004775 [Vespula pensylvanica]
MQDDVAPPEVANRKRYFRGGAFRVEEDEGEEEKEEEEEEEEEEDEEVEWSCRCRPHDVVVTNHCQVVMSLEELLAIAMIYPHRFVS